MKTVNHASLPTIVVKDTQFVAGFEAGSQYYQYAETPLSDLDMYNVFMRTCLDISHTDCYHAGFITGWYAALFGCSHLLHVVSGAGYMQEVQA